MASKQTLQAFSPYLIEDILWVIGPVMDEYQDVNDPHFPLRGEGNFSYWKVRECQIFLVSACKREKSECYCDTIYFSNN